MIQVSKKYSVIYADPPWWYSQRCNPGTAFKLGARGHYDVMKTKDIMALPIADLAADNCAIFMWATFPNLPEQLEVLKAWGFRYRTVGFTWVKTNPKKGDPFFGVGYYTKSNAEVCLLAIKGRMKPVSNSVSSVIISPRGRHSEKPAEARNRIVQLFGDLPRIELFARQKYDGWDSWGNEVESDIKLLAEKQVTILNKMPK